jgi:hypothetical protein
MNHAPPDDPSGVVSDELEVDAVAGRSVDEA